MPHAFRNGLPVFNPSGKPAFGCGFANCEAFYDWIVGGGSISVDFGTIVDGASCTESGSPCTGDTVTGCEDLAVPYLFDSFTEGDSGGFEDPSSDYYQYMEAATVTGCSLFGVPGDSNHHARLFLECIESGTKLRITARLLTYTLACGGLETNRQADLVFPFSSTEVVELIDVLSSDLNFLCEQSGSVYATLI